MSNSKFTAQDCRLDQVLHGLISGDNIVGKVNSIEHYQFLLSHFALAKAANKNWCIFILINIRALIPDDIGRVHRFYPEEALRNLSPDSSGDRNQWR